MRTFFLTLITFISISAFAQQEMDTVYRRCPIFITDTITANNFFLEGLPATLTVDRVKDNLTVTVRQKDQFFTIFFSDKKLKTGKYNIAVNPGKHGVAAKYSFRSGDQVSYVNVSSGTIDVSFDDAKGLWLLKVKGLIANLVGRSISYYSAKANLYFK